MVVEHHEKGIGGIHRYHHHWKDNDAHRNLPPRPFIQEQQGEGYRQQELHGYADAHDEESPHHRIYEAGIVKKVVVVPEPDRFGLIPGNPLWLAANP